MYAHNYAVEIEEIMRRVFDCERGGAAGMADADIIEGNWYGAIAFCLGYLYRTKPIEVEVFIRNYQYYFRFDLKQLLDFAGNTKSINGCEYELEYKNGEDAISAVIQAFDDLCK